MLKYPCFDKFFSSPFDNLNKFEINNFFKKILKMWVSMLWVESEHLQNKLSSFFVLTCPSPHQTKIVMSTAHLNNIQSS